MKFECPVENGIEASKWIQYLLHECAYSSQDIISVSLGYFSILCWLFAQVPQFYKNAALGTSESLSLVFLWNWLLGDVCNLVGCILTNQMRYQTYLASYFVMIDSSLLLQALYYRLFERLEYEEYVVVNVDCTEETIMNQENGIETDSEESNQFQANEGTKLLTGTTTSYSAFIATGVWQFASSKTGNLVLLNAEGHDSSYEFGRTMAWTCTFLYLSSRLPQIYKNFKRQTCDGLAIGMFACAVCGNITYATSIILKAGDLEYLYGALPYLLGTAGTVVFDIIIFIQYLVYPSSAGMLDYDHVI